MEQKFTFKKLLSLLVVCAMLLSSFTFLAFAEEATNVALGKEYTAPESLGGYNASLTDGVKDTAMAYNGDKWFAFKSHPTDGSGNLGGERTGSVVIDLDGSFDLTEVKIHTIANDGSGITPCSAANVYLSDDGENWGEAIALPVTAAADVETNVAYYIEGTVEGTASYVKVDLTMGEKTFLFFNEIEVYGTEADEAPDAPVGSSIAVDGDLSDWEDNWTLVDGETGYWQSVPTDEDQLAGSYNFQITSDETNVYVAAEIFGLDCTAFRVWFRTNPEATVYTHFYHIDATGAAGKANTSTTTNSAAAIENSAAAGVFAAGEESIIVEFSVPLAEIGATGGDVEYYANTQSGSTLFYPPVVDGEGGSRTANLPYNNWYVAPEEDPGEDPGEDDTVEPFNIPVGSINAYGWGNDGYPVILAYGEGATVASTVGGAWFEWWFKVKAEWNETEGAFIVNDTVPSGSKAYEEWTFTANEIVMLVYSGTETYAEAKNIIAGLTIGDKLYASGFDFTNASANNLIVDGESPVNFSNVAFEEEPAPAPTTSQVVNRFNPESYADGTEGSNSAFIFTDADVYAAASFAWWRHVAFAPIEGEDGLYQVVAVSSGAGGTGGGLEMPEGGFIWVAYEWPEEGTSGAYAIALLNTIDVGAYVQFTGVDFENCTTAEDATAVKSDFVDPNAPVNIALGKNYELSGCGNRTSYYGSLTDGSAVMNLNGDNNVNWFGFYNNGTDASVINAPNGVGYAIIDLEAVYTVNGVKVGIIGQPGWGIANPGGIKAYASLDGESFEEIGTFEFELETAGVGEWTEITADCTARYIKVEFTLAGTFAFTNEIEVYGEEYVPEPAYKEGLTIEIDDTLVGWIGGAEDLETIENGLTDGNWGAGDANNWNNVDGVYPFMNKVPTDGSVHPEVNLIYNFGEATDFNTINLGVYSSYNVMIGYPSNLIYIYTSENGFDWSEGTEAYLTLDAPELGKEGSVKTTLHLAETLNAQYVKVVLTFPDSPFADKVVWEFIGLTEIEITYEEAYKEGLTVEIDDTLVGWIGGAEDLETIENGLTDGNWGAGDANNWNNVDGVYPFMNKVPTDGSVHPEVNLIYNFGEATDVNTVKLGVYSSYNVMIGYPSNLITVYTSSNGFDWYYGCEAYLTLDAPELGKEGSVTTTVTLPETLNAQYVKVVLTFPDSPFADKVVWEFIGVTEIELDYVPVTSNVVTDWNPDGYKNSIGGATGAFIYDDADIYAACGNDWWIHVAFAPVADKDGYYEVVAVRAPTTGNYLAMPETGFIWMAWSSAGDSPETAGAYALDFMSNLKVGDIVEFVGVDFANHTTEAYAYAEVWVDPDAPVNVALGKDYELSGPEDGTYNANLTDGNAYAGMSYDNKWFVFNKTNSPDGIGSAIIDLGGLYDISKVAVNLINETTSGVAKPEYVKFYVSEDGEAWTDLGEATLQDVQSSAYWTGIEDLSVTAQFVKLEVKIGAPFSFLNEIEVYGKAAPVKVELVEGENNITVPALNSAIANTNFDKDYVITIEGQWDVTVVVNGVEYWPNRMGNLEAPLPAGENTVEFKNSAEDEVAIVAVVAAPIVGDTMDDPIVLDKDGDYTANVTDKYPNGVFYQYVATEDGTVTITITTEAGWTYVINNLTAGKYGDMHWSDDETVVATETIEVTAGDVIEIIVSTYDPTAWGAPVGTVDFTLDVPGEADPETVEIALGDANMDGVINQYDYIIARRAYFGTIELTEAQTELVDVNNDGKIDQYDYLFIARHYFGTYVIEGVVEVPVDALPAE